MALLLVRVLELNPPACPTHAYAGMPALGMQPSARPLQRPAALQAQPVRLWRHPLPQRRQQQQRVRAEQPQQGQQGGSGAEDAQQSAEYISDSELEDGPVGKREKGVRRALQVRSSKGAAGPGAAAGEHRCRAASNK